MPQVKHHATHVLTCAPMLAIAASLARLLPHAVHPRRKPSTRDILIVVRDGYHPREVTVAAWRPVRLRFRREEGGRCSDTVLLPQLGRYAELPEGQTVTLDLGPLAPGAYDFCCPHGALEGKLRVGPAP